MLIKYSVTHIPKSKTPPNVVAKVATLVLSRPRLWEKLMSIRITLTTA
jgi:hypothetical protein